MNKVLKIIGLPDHNQVQLCLENRGGRRTAPPVPFSHYLDDEQYREIAWYIQSYPEEPSGPSNSRAEAVESGLLDLGRRLFETVFRGNSESWSCCEAAIADGLSDYRLVISSRNSAFLALPWELLRGPDGGYFCDRVASVLRRTGTAIHAGFSPINRQFNVLWVSPMPLVDEYPAPPSETLSNSSLDGGWPGGSGSLAIESLEVLDSINVEVELDYLRPPTFSTLSDRLSRNPGRYRLVYFDNMIMSTTGALLFEAEDRAGDQVEAAEVAELLAEARVPLALISAARTGPLSPSNHWRHWADAGAKLVAGGVPQVVSLPVPLAEGSRESFLRPIFQAVARGGDLPWAVAQARKALRGHPPKLQPPGKAGLGDLIGPVIYQHGDYTPAPVIQEPASPPLQPLQAETPQEADPLPQGGRFGLVGRRSELFHLERLFGQGPVVLLHGGAGVGKTELALALGRWLRKTQSRTGGVFYTSFDFGAGLERVVHEAGATIAGLEFADMAAGEQRRWLVDYLNNQPSLLIWDGLERAAGFPNQSTGLLDQEELSELDSLLREVTSGGQSWVLLVSRRGSETWLTTPHQVRELTGLDQRDALTLGGKVLENAGVKGPARERSDGSESGANYPEFPQLQELLELLEGHPLALQIALPLLKELPPAVLVDEIKSSIARLSPEDWDDYRAPYLTASMDYAFSRMPRRSRVHLPFLALFQQRVMMDILSHITQEQPYRRVMGEELGWGACRTVLRSARDAGFLEAVTPSVYRVLPSFSWFYGRRLHRQVAASGISRLEQEFLRVYADTADYFMETLYENQDSGATAVLAEEGNLTQALALALEAKQWDRAQLLVQPLAQVYRMQKRYPELRRLRRRVMQEVTPAGGGASEAEQVGAIELWLYLTGTAAGEAAELGELDRAENLNRELLGHLASRPEGDADPRTGAVYHQLGLVAQKRRRLAEAEEWFMKSLSIIEAGEDKSFVADDYFSLGQVAQHLRRYTEAQDWFRKALDIHQRLDDPEEMVKDYRALGLSSQLKFEYDQAESWYQRAREIVEENRDEETALLVYHELGTLCHARYQYDAAESWYRQALTLSDRLGKESQMAVEFHHLGLLAQGRELFHDDAEEWYLLALDKYESLGDRVRAGDECRQLGVLFHEQKRLEEAESWYHRACGIFEELRDVQRAARTYGQLGMAAEERGDLPGALEWVSRTYRLTLDHDLPMLAQVKAHLRRLRDKYGADRFTLWWRESMAGNPPADLEEDTG